MPRVYVASTESKRLIAEAKKKEDKGEDVDWETILQQVSDASAKTREQQIAAEVNRK